MEAPRRADNIQPMSVRSPLLDWLGAARRRKRLIALCIVVGVIGGLVAAAVLALPRRYRSVAVVIIEADFIDIALEQRMGVPVWLYDPSLTDATLFESIAMSDGVLRAAVADAEQLDPANAPERAEAVRKQLGFEYKIGVPKVTISVRGETAESAHALAEAILGHASANFDAARQAKLEKGLARVREQKVEATKTQSIQRIEFLTSMESRYLDALSLERPEVYVASPPSLPERPELKPISWGFWSAAGLALGLGAALLLIGFRLHAEAMRELNPSRYGGDI